MSTASPATIVGLQIFDNVNLSGGANPTGTLTFNLFGPGDLSCFTPIFTSTVAVSSGNGSYNSNHFTTSQAGTYRWVVSYSGDSNNNPIGPAPCSTPSESVIVDKAGTGLSTIASPSVPVGGMIRDTATLGGFRPTGTITFRLSGPDDMFCGAAPIFTAAVPVTAGAGNYPSPVFTPTATGTYRWQASYTGDSNNQAVAITSCLDPYASVTVTQGKTTPTISTTASQSVPVGGTITDTAALAGGANPTGTLTFTLFDPNNNACAGGPLFTSSKTVAGNGNYTSDPFTATTAGIYHFQAAYSGDANNAAIAVTPCGAIGGNVTVTPAATTTTVTSSANPSILGQALALIATVASVDGGGSVGFFADGSLAPLSGCATVPLTVAGTAYQAACTSSTLAAGNHPVKASYSGDTNSAPSTGALGGGQTVNQAPTISSASGATFIVGVAASLAVTATGFPTPTVTESGPLPSGVTFNGTTQTLSGTPAQGSAGIYPVSFVATNGVGTAVAQNFTLKVGQATMTYPTEGQSSVDPTQPFTWSTIPQAQGYILAVGTTVYATDLANSGILPPTQSSFSVTALPAGPTLHATLLAQVNGAWTSYQAISFIAAPSSQAAFTFPLNAQTGVDPTQPFTWSTIPQAQGYILVIGTSQYGTNLVNSGVLPPTQSTYPITPNLPTGQTLYATLLTEVNGAFTRFQAITFTAGPAMGTFNQPVNGQLNVATPSTFTWSTIAGAQNYYLAVGTTLYGIDLVNSGILSPTQSSFNVLALPHGQLLHATLLTKVNGTWVFQAVDFTAA